jgi:two-component system chemotaxis response regulator CheB
MVNLITALPAASKAGMLSLQSIPPKFSHTLSSYLNLRCRFEVRPLSGDVRLNPGRCYIGTEGLDHSFSMVDGQLGLQERPSGLAPNETDNTDRLFSSAAELFSDRAVVILLSGAGIGSLDGLRAVKDAGGTIISPRLEDCILPASLQPAVDANLITEMFKASDMMDILKRCCS